jgi:hypothetical protein
VLKSDSNKYPAVSRLQAKWIACQLLSVGYMLGSFLDPEGGGSIFFLKVDGLTPEYMVLRRHYCENIMSTI